MGLLRSKSHPRASYASGNRSALWAVENNFRAPKKKKKNLGVREFMEFGTHKCDSLCAFSARCCAKIRSPLCCSCRHCRVDGGRLFCVRTEGSSEEDEFGIDSRELRSFG